MKKSGDDIQEAELGADSQMGTEMSAWKRIDRELSLRMGAPVESLPGIGPKKGEVLRRAGIKTVRDFFYNLPRDYDNFQQATSIAEMRPGKVVVRGRISDLTTRRARRRNLSITEGVVRDNTGAVKVIWFNQSYRARQFAPDKEYFFTGTYELKNGRWQLTAPQAALVADLDPSSSLSPVYVAHGAIKSHDFARLVRGAQERFAKIPDLLPILPSDANRGDGRNGAPSKVPTDYGVSGVDYNTPGVRREALYQAHFPGSLEEVASARGYLAYEELFSLILAARLNQKENEKLRALPVPFEAERIRKLVGSLPFQLTGAQRRAAWEIFQDMERDTPMNRLLQGDVGSGKTMVAALAAYEAIGGGATGGGAADGLRGAGGGEAAGESAAKATSHGQVALLAPTAILAAQHFEGLSEILGKFGVRTELLIGATKKKDALKARIKAGEVDLVIGTHALLTDDTEFQNLTLVIIDEQHRFGVEQRQKLMLKSPAGLAPHLLSMTATPIPRSLQLTVFGDLDVSILNELPKGRQPIKTEILPEINMANQLYPKMWEILREKPDKKGVLNGSLAKGQQIYWICKAIDDDPRTETTSVKSRAKRLAEAFPGVSIEFLHGRMKPAEKDAVMERFSSGETQILVSTTVVEVGVDVPNATLIVIENAESYGLAQLHQLRGRVGRGASASYCFLVTSGDDRPSRRLLELERSNDGFHLAEVDLKLRGPGEIYGALQHGALDLRIATLSDTKTIARARAAVDEFLSGEAKLEDYPELMSGISKYQQLTTLN